MIWLLPRGVSPIWPRDGNAGGRPGRRPRDIQRLVLMKLRQNEPVQLVRHSSVHQWPLVTTKSERAILARIQRTWYVSRKNEEMCENDDRLGETLATTIHTWPLCGRIVLISEEDFFRNFFFSLCAFMGGGGGRSHGRR
jgi:hypothetical protein